MADLPEPSFSFDDLKLHHIDVLWDSVDVEIMGRFLRAHLVVEFFVNEHLEKISLVEGEKLPWQFSQKLKLLRAESAFVQWVGPGLKLLNELRNKLAHELTYELTHEEVRGLFPEDQFNSYMVAFTRKKNIKSYLPIDVVEAFAEFAMQMLRMETTLKDKLDEMVSYLEAGGEPSFAGDPSEDPESNPPPGA